MPEDTSAAASAMSPTDESGRLSPTPLGPVAPAEPKKKRPFAKSLLFNMVSGGSAGEVFPDFLRGNALVFLLILGCIEASIMHPLDLVKTRFQLQSNAAAAATGLQVK